MKTRWFTIPAVFACSLLACSVNPAKITGASGDGYRQMRSELDRKIPKILKKHDLSSMVVLVVDDQEVVYAKGFGYADKKDNKTTTTEIAYRIGSITKLFTAISILQLQDQGRLDIDNPLQTYLPEFSMASPYGLEGITLRSMLSHYSGLPSDYDKGFSSYSAEKTLLDDLSDEYVVFKPGDVHAYSNLAFGLLGQVIEKVSGQPYDDYLREHIFNPLGMKNASLGSSSIPDFAVMYQNDELVKPVEIRDRAAGDIRMSADDLASFAKAMLRYDNEYTTSSQSLLSRDSVNEMWRSQYNDAPLDSGFKMGLGWILSYPSKALANVSDIVWHDGSTVHHNSSLLIDRRDKLAVIVLSNTAETTDTSVASEVAGNTLLAAIRSKNGSTPEPFIPVSSPVKKFTTEQLVRLKGRYISNEFGEFTIQGNEEELFASIDGERTELVPMDDGTFGIEYRLFGIIPITPAAISELRFQLVEYHGEQVAKVVRGPPVAKKVELKSLPESMSRYLGHYELTNPDQLQSKMGLKKLLLSDADGYLRGQLDVNGEELIFYFDVIEDNRATSLGYGRGMGGSAFFGSNDLGQAQVRFSGLRFVKTESNSR